jgi:hypothetical protein
LSRRGRGNQLSIVNLALGGGFAQESVQLRPGLWVSDQAFPRFLVLAGQEKARKVGQFGLLVNRQSFANSNDFLCSAAHIKAITANRRKLKRSSSTERNGGFGDALFYCGCLRAGDFTALATKKQNRLNRFWTPKPVALDTAKSVENLAFSNQRACDRVSSWQQPWNQ